MDNLNIDINLLKLSRAGVTTIHGLRCVVIPTDENDIYVSQDAQTGKPKAAYLRVTAWANKNGVDQYGHSHYMKQSFSKEYRNTHPDANRNAPILGNGKPVQVQGGATPSAQPPITNPANTSLDNDEDLPF